MSNAMTEPPYLEALRQQEQADMDGTMVRVSRQAVDEAITDIERLRAALLKLTDHFYHGDEWSGVTRGETITAVERFARAALGEPK